MANDEHAAILKKGGHAWNKWRRQKRRRRQKKVTWVGELAESDPTDLTGAYLPSACLPGADVTMVDLSGADLECAGLIGAGPIQGDS